VEAIASLLAIRTTIRQVIEQARERREAAKNQREQAQRQREEATRQLQRARQLCAQARAQRAVTAHELIPLDLAAAAVYRRAYDDFVNSPVQGRPTAHLDAVAYSIAELANVYAYTCDGKSVRVLSKEELSGALFRDGARTATYLDGRPDIKNLALSAKALEAIVLALRNARGLGDARRVVRRN
jgi:hypothetical protein